MLAAVFFSLIISTLENNLKISLKKFAISKSRCIFVSDLKTNTMTTLVKDSQSRIVRYGMKCFQVIDGMKCYAFAHANKKGNTLVISEAFNTCVNANGQSVSGTYKIVSVGTGRIAEVVCEKL